MKYLDQDFRESITALIDKDGNVVIGGIPFIPIEILDDDAVSYKEAFLGWMNEQWIPLREDRLAKILTNKTNQQRFNELVQAVRAEQVVPFVGSGLSAVSGMPLWSNFLRELRKDSTLAEADLEKLLSAGQFEDAATQLLVKMPKQLFDERLEQTFLARKDADVAGAVRFLPEIFTETAITTNFDNVLEVANRICGNPFTEALNGASIAQFRMLRGKGKRCLLKIHGDHTNPAGRVLTKEEYDAAYGPNCPARTELEYLFGSEPLLFMGCSLEADRTMVLLKEIVAGDNGTPRNYAFLKRPVNEDARIAREHFLSERKIFPIWYEDEHNESVEALLFGLLRAIGKF